MSGIFNLITALEPGDGDEAVPEHLHLGADVEAEGGHLLCGEGVPVPEGAAQVILLVVIMAPGHDNINNCKLLYLSLLYKIRLPV